MPDHSSYARSHYAVRLPTKSFIVGAMANFFFTSSHIQT